MPTKPSCLRSRSSFADHHGSSKGTTECAVYQVEVTLRGRPKSFTLIDTPGFVDVPEDNLTTLDKIAKMLHKFPHPVSGALYFHRITDKRLHGTSRDILSIFKSICGDKFYPYIAYVTTMWDLVHPNRHHIFQEVNKTLGETHMRVPDGAPVFRRMRDDVESCRDVLERFLDLTRAGLPPSLQLMKEYGSGRGSVRKTCAGREILKKIDTGGPRFCNIM